MSEFTYNPLYSSFTSLLSMQTELALELIALTLTEKQSDMEKIANISKVLDNFHAELIAELGADKE